jgi:ParB/Sulfiredoxin domain
VKSKSIKIHPAAEAYRLMTEEELASLAADMAANGQRDPIVLGRVNGVASEALVDGRNRLRACEIAGIDPRFETIQFENDDEVRAFVKSSGERRNISKGEQAMAIAILYPDPEKGGRGKRSQFREGFDGEARKTFQNRLTQARAVYRYSPELAAMVRDGVVKLDEALKQVEDSRKELQSAETQIAQLRAEASDLADLVDEERMPLSEAFAAFERRQEVAAEKEKNLRETLLRSAEAAFGSFPSWANEEFVAAVRVRLDDPEFRDLFCKRVRPESRPLRDIERGAAAFAEVLKQLEKHHGGTR